MNFTDTMISDGKLRKTDDGHVVQARVAKGGNVQDYAGAEIGFADCPVVRVYRPTEAVFSKDAIQTYARKPITIGHPANGVTDETWRDLAVGEIDRDVMRDGEFVSVPLLFRDAAAVALMQATDGPKELSMGYEANITMKDGVSPAGEAYDAVMTDFRMNHVAVVPRARGGSELRIGDGADKWGAMPITHADEKEVIMTDKLQTVVLGDQAVQVSATDVATITKFKADADKRVADMETAHASELAAKDAEIEKATAAKDAAEAKVLSDADLDKRVADRADLISTAKTIAKDVATDGLSDAAIRKAVVVAKLGDAMADKPEAYIDARFDILAEDAGKGDAFADALQKDGFGTPQANVADKAYADNLTHLGTAWMGNAKKEA